MGLAVNLVICKKIGRPIINRPKIWDLSPIQWFVALALGRLVPSYS